jgi:small subunit ribosomal protein S18
MTEQQQAKDKAQQYAPMANSRVFFRRVKSCPLSDYSIKDVNYKNIKLISRFVSERGRILPSRITSISAKKQRALKQAIKQARALALLPFVQKY